MTALAARRRTISRRRAARFAAVQALYQLEVTGEEPETVIAEFRTHRLHNLLESVAPRVRLPRADADWFAHVVRGTWRERARLDALLEPTLAAGWTLKRCGYLLRACLRAGTFELLCCPEVPFRVVINEYVEVAHLFFGGDEPRFVNAVLDRLSRELRREERDRER